MPAFAKTTFINRFYVGLLRAETGSLSVSRGQSEQCTVQRGAETWDNQGQSSDSGGQRPAKRSI